MGKKTEMIAKNLLHCTCSDCMEKAANIQKHLDHPFYAEVKEYVDEVEHQQILKGAEKYPEPYNPNSWTGEELALHAMQELRDGQVYVTGMRQRMLKQEKIITSLKMHLSRIARMDQVGMPPEYVVKRYAEYARDVLEALESEIGVKK